MRKIDFFDRKENLNENKNHDYRKSMEKWIFSGIFVKNFNSLSILSSKKVEGK